VVIKRGADPTLVRSGDEDWQSVPIKQVQQVVDTTAAGDSFAAGYLSRRLQGAPPFVSASFGNELAARVIQYHGAIIPTEAMADLV
jgi:2-dehydro-3-deoxygluconokinase